MSNPANVLDRYQSYSYHHILYACDNSRAANYLASNEFEIPEVQDSIQAIPLQGDIIPVEDNPNSTEREQLGNYAVLINGLSDTRYVISKVEWETLTAATVNTSDMGNSLAVEGSMSIQEPRGFEFMNILDRIQDEFDTDATGIIFLMKTIFVGHVDQDSLSSTSNSATNIISNIRPLQFMLLDLTAAFDVTGGMYNLKFVGLNNGASRLPQISRAAEMNSFTPKSRILHEVMSEFSAILSNQAQADYDKVVDQVKKNEAIPEESANNLRRVEYKIEMRDPYNDDRYVLNNFDTTVTETGTVESLGPIHLGIKFTVEQVIQRIMSMSKQVQDELTRGIDGVKYRYKVSSSIEMTKEPNQEGSNVTTNDEVLRVTYFVERFPELTNVSVTALLQGQQSDEDTTQQQIQDNLITFDYIFTGRNVDIKHFDMKLNQGLLFLQTLRTTDNKMTQRELIENGTPVNKDTAVGNLGARTNSNTDSDEVTNSIRSRTPVFPGTTVKDVVSKNIGEPTDTTTFNAALQQHAALETLETVLTIRGNPYLMSQTNRPAREPLDTNPALEEEEREIQVLKNWDRIPAIAQVNIRMPLNSETPGGENASEILNFWYDGYYYIFGIKHKFDGGEFTQKLDMLSMPQNSFFDPLETSEVNNTGDTDNNTGSDTAAGSGSQASSEGNSTSRDAVKRVKGTPPSQTDRKRFRTGQ